MSMMCMLHAVAPAEIEALLAEPDRIETWLDGGASGPRAELDKSWHGLHYLLTGAAWDGPEPLCYLVTGGQEIGDDLGYGPARALTPAQVAAFDAALSPLSPAALEARFDHAAMRAAQLYAISDSPDDAAEDLEYLLEFFATLQRFVRETAARQQGLVIYLC